LRGLEDKDVDIINVHKARQYALKLLSYRGRSERELEGRLRQKGFPENVVSSTIRYLKHAGLIDDRALAEALKREAMTTKLLSQYSAKILMLNRGIPKEIANSMFILNGENEDMANAEKLVEKKLRSIKNLSEEKINRRLYNLLLRRGYSYDTIKGVLKKKNLKEG